MGYAAVALRAVAAAPYQADAAHDVNAIEELGDEIAAAAALYRGPFLQSVHLAAVQPWQQWCDAQRSRLTRAIGSTAVRG